MDEVRLSTSKRLDIIDVLRGFALAGILYAHMVIWYTGAALPTEVYTKYDSTADGIAMGIFGGLVFGKFFSVFSFLFGISFFLHFKKKQHQQGFLKIYLWRICLLFIIGIIHHIFWRGDILAIYAVLGVFLIFFRRLPSGLMLIISLLLIFNLPTHIFDAFQAQSSVGYVSFPMQEEAREYYLLVDKGSFVQVLIENWNSWASKIQYQLESGRLLMTFGYFLLGYYAGCTNLFVSIKEKLFKFKILNKYSGRTALFLLVIGWWMYINSYVTLPELNILVQYKAVAAFLFDIYNGCVTVFYITGISILFLNPFFQKLLLPLASLGKMALTNYLLQTVFGLLVFYNFGLDLFDKTSPAVNVFLAILIFYLQLKMSEWWLTQFKQGPAEWLWKSLTYFKVFSLRRASKSQIPQFSERR